MFSSKPKTTAEVLSVFTKTITELESVANAHVAEAVKQRETIAAAEAALEIAHKEIDAATNAKAKLEAFLA